MAKVDPFLALVLRRFRGLMLALCVGGLGAMIDRGVIDLPEVVNIVLLVLFVVGFGAAIWLFLHDLIWTWRQSTPLVIALTLGVGVLGAWGYSRHLAKESQSQSDHERLVAVDVKMDKATKLLEDFTKVQRSPTATRQSLSALIRAAAGNCVDQFDLGWQLFLIDGTHIEGTSGPVGADELGIKVFWNTTRIGGFTKDRVEIHLPTVVANNPQSHGAKWEDNTVVIPRGECTVVYTDFGDDTFRMGAAAVVDDGNRLLAIIGLRRTRH